MARTASILTLARKIEAARVKLAEAVRVKQQELERLDSALRRVLGTGGARAGSANGRVSRKGVRGRRRAGRRSRNGQLRKGSLPATIVEVLPKNGKSSTIEEILRGAKARGYKSKAAPQTQRVMVNQTLSRLVKSGMARKTGRGQYAANV